MAELNTTKLNPESHLLLDESLLRMPYNMARQHFKSAQRAVEHGNAALRKDMDAATKSATKSTSSESVEALDKMINRMSTLKRKLEVLQGEEDKCISASKARITHLKKLYEIHSLVDVKYDEWSRIRLSRLLVDYLLRSGYMESAQALSQSTHIEELVDIDAFAAAVKIEKSLKDRNTNLALKWCQVHSKELQKMDSELEFELRLQQFIELARAGHMMIRRVSNGDMEDPEGKSAMKLREARSHVKKFLGPPGTEIMGNAAGLLIYGPEDELAECHARLYSPDRWTHLSTLFIRTHHKLFSLPPIPLLHIALSAGLSALKTPSCHSKITSPSANAATSSTSVCPICSTELNALAKNVPYANHTKSITDHDCVVLPNGRVYGRFRLKAYNEKIGTSKGRVRDPMGDPSNKEDEFEEAQVRKLYVM